MSVIYSPAALIKGARALFFQALAMAMAGTGGVGRFAMVVNSASRSEDYTWLDDAPQMTPAEAEIVYSALSDADYELINAKYRAGLRVLKDDLDDDETQGIIFRIQQMAGVAAHHPFKLLVAALVAGTSTNCIDGGPFFAASHPEKGPGLAGYSNLYSGVSGTSTANVLAQITAAIELMGAYLAKNGEPANEEIRNLFIMAPWALRTPIKEALQATIIDSTSNVQTDDINWDIKITARLTAGDAYYIGMQDGPVRGLVFQDREATQFVAQDQPTDQASFDHEEYRYKTTARHVAGYGNPQMLVKIDAS